MESYLNDIQSILRDITSAENDAEELISDFDRGFQRVLQKHALARNTPIKPKQKKAKGRVDRGPNLDDSLSSTCSSNVTSIASASQQINETQTEESKPLRPVRTARAKQTCYTEPSLHSKLRREDVLTPDGVRVKVERQSTENRLGNLTQTIGNSTIEPEPAAEPTPAAELTLSRPIRVKKEKEDKDTASKSKSEKNGKAAVDGSKSKHATNDERRTNDDDDQDDLQILPMEINAPIELSDDESVNDENKMPPPVIVPPAKVLKEKKIRSTRSKQPKRKIKQESVSEGEEESAPSASSTATEMNESTATSVATVKRTETSATNRGDKKPSRAMNVSGESLYEDAVSDQPPKNVFNAYVSLLKIPSSQASDATFVTTTDENESEQQRGMSPRGTYVIPKENGATDAVDDGNTTFDIVPSTSATKQTIKDKKLVTASKSKGGKDKISAVSSIMTDDDSDTDTNKKGAERIPINVGSTNKKGQQNELFNPSVQKTIKQRVEAIEKLQSPAPQNTRGRQMNEADIFAKPQNPLFQKGTSTSSTTDSHGKHLRTYSATRAAGQNTNKVATLQKSQSVEDFRKKNQAVADEKKKKQDEKLRKAQLLREAQEKEKAERNRKLLLEKEQRTKEKQQQKQQEELAKQQELRRKEAEREQKRKEAKEAKERREADMARVMAEKRAMQEKLKANQRAEELRRKNAQHQNAYGFDMLESGDSTDDEGKPSTKRPPPPLWSLSHNRQMRVVEQSKVDTKQIDTFFSVAPLEVNLREIFPQIDEKHLRRNSSAVWNSPPRYSLLPKY